MNPLLRLFAVATLVTASLGHAADAFEGKVSLAITSGKGKSMVMDYSIKGRKVRTDMNAEGQAFASILDLDKLEMLLLMPEQQMYMTMPVKKPVQQAMAQAQESTADVEVTGKTETILGYTCHQILVKDKGTVTEVWAAEGLGVFAGLGQGGPMGGGGGPFGGRGKSANSAKWEEVIKTKGGFPLRVVSHDAKNRETFKMEATSIQPGAVPDSLFLPPEGYQKFQMPDLGGLMKGLGGQ